MYVPMLVTILFSCAVMLSCAFDERKENEDENRGTGKTTGDESVVWNFDSIEKIGGHPVTVIGEPYVADTPKGKAIVFDGVDDGLLVGVHPLEGAASFTLEVIFRPDSGGLQAQRFFHLQEDDSENRILIETRLTGDGYWYLDTFIKSDETDQTLIDDKNLHPVDEWYNATLVFDGSEMRHYVNGVQELSARISSFTPPKKGKTSIGVRINRVYWFKGAMRCARFTRKALEPSAFLKP